MSRLGRTWLRFGPPRALALAIVGYPILTLTITGLLAVP